MNEYDDWIFAYPAGLQEHNSIRNVSNFGSSWNINTHYFMDLVSDIVRFYLFTYSLYMCVCVDLCHSGRIRGQILPTQIQPHNIRMQDSLCWSWSTLFQVTKNRKSCILNTFCPSIKHAQNSHPSSNYIYIYIKRERKM